MSVSTQTVAGEYLIGCLPSDLYDIYAENALIRTCHYGDSTPTVPPQSSAISRSFISSELPVLGMF